MFVFRRSRNTLSIAIAAVVLLCSAISAHSQPVRFNVTFSGAFTFTNVFIVATETATSGLWSVSQVESGGQVQGSAVVGLGITTITEGGSRGFSQSFFLPTLSTGFNFAELGAVGTNNNSGLSIRTADGSNYLLFAIASTEAARPFDGAGAALASPEAGDVGFIQLQAVPIPTTGGALGFLALIAFAAAQVARRRRRNAF